LSGINKRYNCAIQIIILPPSKMHLYYKQKCTSFRDAKLMAPADWPINLLQHTLCLDAISLKSAVLRKRSRHNFAGVHRWGCKFFSFRLVSDI